MTASVLLKKLRLKNSFLIPVELEICKSEVCSMLVWNTQKMRRTKHISLSELKFGTTWFKALSTLNYTEKVQKKSRINM